jgi:hypothetical protein
MPEYFWNYGFKPKDFRRMQQEEEDARGKTKYFEDKYSSWTDNEKLKVEQTYREILEYVESVRRDPAL